jgi:hypothetical protein
VTSATRVVRRLATPAAFLVVLVAMLLLPFVGYRLQFPPEDGEPAIRIEVTCVGATAALDWAPRVSVATQRDDGRWNESNGGNHGVLERGDDSITGARTFGRLALVLLLVVGLVGATLPRPRVRAVVSAAVAFLAGLAVLASSLRTQQDVARAAVELAGPLEVPVELRYGFWFTCGLLVVVGFVNVAAAVPMRRRSVLAS